MPKQTKLSKTAFHALGENRGGGPVKSKPVPVSKDVEDTSKAGRRDLGTARVQKDSGRELRM